MSTREKLEKKLNNYLVLYPHEKTTTKIMIEFLKNDQDCFKRNNWNGHFTGSSWVLDETRSYVLMVHHRQLNLWLQPGGHADGRADLLSVAIDETREENTDPTSAALVNIPPPTRANSAMVEAPNPKPATTEMS